MNHSFQPSIVDSAKCARCQYDEISHTDRATCECCSNSGTMELKYGMLMCSECIAKEDIAQVELKAGANDRVLDMRARLEQAKHEIVQRTDIFNARPVPLVEIIESVEKDESITNKDFEQARLVLEWFNHLKTVMFEIKQKELETGTLQRAAQAYLNEKASKLRAEEREKLKLSDLNYKPQAPKLSKPKTVRKAAPKFDKAEVKKYAAELGIPEFNIQTMCVKRSISPKEAADILKEMLGL